MAVEHEVALVVVMSSMGANGHNKGWWSQALLISMTQLLQVRDGVMGGGDGGDSSDGINGGGGDGKMVAVV